MTGRTKRPSKWKIKKPAIRQAHIRRSARQKGRAPIWAPWCGVACGVRRFVVSSLVVREVYHEHFSMPLPHTGFPSESSVRHSA